MANINGSGNHPEEDDKDNKVVRFPSRADRAEMDYHVEKMVEKAKFARHASEASNNEPIFNIPTATKYFCGLLIAVHVAMQLLPSQVTEQILQIAVFLPPLYFTDMPLSDLDRIAAVVGPFSHMLLHGGWVHLAVNTLMLLAMGSGVEKDIGAKKMLLIFLLSGLLGAFTHLVYIAWFYPNDFAPMVGASGGISGLFGSVIMMSYLRGHLGMGGPKVVLAASLVWILISLVFGIFGMPGTGAAIAWTTHIGGFIAGLLLYRPIAKMNMR